MIGHYLMFNGNCEDALKLYERAFDTKVTELRKYSDMPPNPNFPIPKEKMNLVLHSRLTIDGVEFMCADGSRPLKSGDNMYVTITSGNSEYVQKAWEALAEDGEIFMELAPSFFAKLHGSLQDKFGVNWMFTAQ